MKLLTREQLANEIQVSEQTIKRWIKSGMPKIKYGNTTRFQLEEIVEWMKSRGEQ